MGSPLYNPFFCVLGFAILGIASLVGFSVHTTLMLQQQRSDAPRQQHTTWQSRLGIVSGLGTFLFLCVLMAVGLPNVQPAPDHAILVGTWGQRMPTQAAPSTSTPPGLVILHSDGTARIHNLPTIPLIDAERIAFAEGTWSLEHPWNAWVVRLLVKQPSQGMQRLDFQYSAAGTHHLLCIASDHGNMCVTKEQP